MKKVFLLLSMVVLSTVAFTQDKKKPVTSPPTAQEPVKTIKLELPVELVSVLLSVIEDSKNDQIQFKEKMKLYNAVYLQAVQQLQLPAVDKVVNPPVEKKKDDPGEKKQ